MISNNELLAIIAAVERSGATVVVTYDQDALREEGRKIVETVEVRGLKGCGHHPMPAIAAAERLRECLCKQMANSLVKEIVHRQALCATASGTFNDELAVSPLDLAFTKARGALACGGYEPTIDRSVVVGDAKAVWDRFWEEVTLADCSRSTTQRSVCLRYQGRQIEVFDNSIRGYPFKLDQSKANPWEQYTLDEYKPVLVKWMAIARRDLFDV